MLKFVRRSNTAVNHLRSVIIAPTLSIYSRPLSIMSDLSSLVKKDHLEVKGLFEQYKQTPLSDVAKRADIVHKIIKELSVHSGAEEIFMYPKIRTLIPKGNEEADHSIEEHRKAKDVLYQLDVKYKPEQPEYDKLVQQLIQDINHHIEDEETGILDQLDKTVPLAKRQELAQEWLHYKSIATTRVHPMAPDSGSGIAAEIAHMASKPLDAARDAIREATKREY